MSLHVGQSWFLQAMFLTLASVLWLIHEGAVREAAEAGVTMALSFLVRVVSGFYVGLLPGKGLKACFKICEERARGLIFHMH